MNRLAGFFWTGIALIYFITDGSNLSFWSCIVISNIYWSRT